MSKPKASGGRFSFFSPLYLILALLMGVVATVSSWFTEHLTVKGMGPDLIMPALFRAAALYILLLLFDFLFESARPYLLKDYTAPAEDAPAEKAPRAASGLSAGSAKVSASSIGLSGNTAKPVTKELPLVLSPFGKELTNASPASGKEVPKAPPASEKKPGKASAHSGAKTFMIFFFTSLLVLVPAFLALFPGYTAYDTPMQMEQFFTQGILNSTQPVPLTLLFAGCLRLGVTLFRSANAGLLLHTILQLLFNAACLAFVGCFFVRWGIRRRFVLFLIIFLEILPFVQIFALTTAKDGFFSPMFALWLTLTADLFRKAGMGKPKTKRLIVYGLVSFVMILTRPQGKYLFLAAAAVFVVLLIIKIRARKSDLMLPCILRIGAVAAAVILSSALVTGPLYDAAGVYPASPSEKLSVPIQQMTRVVALHENKLTREELVMYDTYFDRSKVATNYIPQISDLMKMSPVFNKAAYMENKQGFFILWLDLLKKYPADYADALLYLTDGYFYQGLGYGHAWAGLADEFIPGPEKYATHAVSLLPAYRKFLIENVGKTFAVSVPVVRRFCVISLPFWVLAVLGSIVLRKRRPASIGILFLIILYFGTLLLGPVCTVRYVIPLFYAIPVLTVLLITEPEKAV